VDDPRKYIRIADGIRREIEAGKRQAGDLVSITYLTQEHDVARQTAAKALGILAREALVKRFPGIGYIVVRPSHSSAPSSGLGVSAP
jgi:DNA-binding GntR family transcriptional regulator